MEEAGATRREPAPVSAAFAGAPVDAVLFDYGGTLVTVSRPHDELLAAYADIARLLAEAGHTPPPAPALLSQVHDRVDAECGRHRDGATLREFDVSAAARSAYAGLGITLDDSLLDEVLRVEQRAWRSGVVARPGAAATLDTLRRAGLRTGLCSNAPYRLQSMHEQLQHCGLRDRLDGVTFSAGVGWRKPDARIFHAALASLGATAARTVMVGDSEAEDVAGARGLGMRCVLLQEQHAHELPPHTAADAVISDVAGVLLLLDLEVPLPILHSRA